MASAQSNSGTEPSLVFRVVNNLDRPNVSEIFLDSRLLRGITTLVETDLLERPLQNGFHRAIPPDGGPEFSFPLEFAPHAIRTFKLL
jgi:hypothetical protein